MPENIQDFINNEAPNIRHLCDNCHTSYDGPWAKKHGQSWESYRLYKEHVQAKMKVKESQITSPHQLHSLF